MGAKIDYVEKLNERVKKGSDENLNAEPFYRKALDLYVEPPARVDQDLLRRWPTELTDVQQVAVRKWIDANAGALAQLRLGAQRPGYWFLYQGTDIVEAHGAQDMRAEIRLSQALGFGAKLAAMAGNTKGAMHDLWVCCRLGADLRKRLFLLEQMAGMLISRHASRTGFQILDKVELDQASRQSLRRQLAELAKKQDSVVDCAGEQLAISAAVQRIYAQWPGSGGKENTRALDEAISSLLADRAKADFGIDLTAEQMYSSVYRYTPPEMASLIQKAFAHYSSIIAKTPFQWHRQGIDWDKTARESVDGNVLLLKLMPAIPTISTMSFRFRVERDALITTLALLGYRNDKAALPADLDELVSAGYLSELPLDPYSERPLVYRRTAGRFILYSVGADFIDNGGTHCVEWSGVRRREGEILSSGLFRMNEGNGDILLFAWKPHVGPTRTNGEK